ncbi:MAG TPA: hypothetical protein VEW42_05720 [Candidatus Eisenbacteria bacterium]|nr:hypothetical protein [Candidatus Eisenbacteria bacterium]
MDKRKLLTFSLRCSIASVFLYAAIAATFQPDNWIGYIPQAIRNIFPANILLMGFSLYQLVLALWILTGWKSVFSASLAALTLLVIILTNISQTDILFRDFAIFFAAIALLFNSL